MCWYVRITCKGKMRRNELSCSARLPSPTVPPQERYHLFLLVKWRFALGPADSDVRFIISRRLSYPSELRDRPQFDRGPRSNELPLFISPSKFQNDINIFRIYGRHSEFRLYSIAPGNSSVRKLYLAHFA